MLNRNIPFYNIIMKKTCPEQLNVPELPVEFELHHYSPGVERQWAELEYEIGDFPSVADAQKYFVEKYLNHPELLEQRGVFVSHRERKCLVGACIAWLDYQGTKPVSSLHWLVTKEQYQNRGIASAMLAAALNIYAEDNGFPVYLHTQPWSYKAIQLYCRYGFHLLKHETFAEFQNQYEQALPILEQYISTDYLSDLIAHSE